MIVVPLVFASLLVGTASISDLKKLGRIGPAHPGILSALHRAGRFHRPVVCKHI